ncbi:hypothetical protein J6590_089214 [Homalodisca vitripennis]|nr:hypothetical protein J6590_089214 [Homalodisca vitripennis]
MPGSRSVTVSHWWSGYPRVTEVEVPHIISVTAQNKLYHVSPHQVNDQIIGHKEISEAKLVVAV